MIVFISPRACVVKGVSGPVCDAVEFNYSGSELEVFQSAERWRAYWMSFVRQYLGWSVLEVGAGIGTITASLSVGVDAWVALEPDAEFCREIQANLPPASGHVRTFNGVLGDLNDDEKFDSVLYIDVLEHIEDDRGEISESFRRLKPGGHLVILVPAHQSLYSPFDEAIGHYRRYAKKDLASLMPAEMRLVSAQYLDSVGLALSWANAKVLSQATPTKAQIAFWDRCVIPISRVLDRVLGFRFGKSLLVIWQAPVVGNGT